MAMNPFVKPADHTESVVMALGIYLFSLATVGAGILDLSLARF